MSYNSGCGYSGGCGGCSSSYSQLERAVYSASAGYSSKSDNVSYMATDVCAPSHVYSNNFSGFNPYSKGYESGSKSRNEITTTTSGFVNDFLNPARQFMAFVGKSSEIKEFAEEAFFRTTGMNFPDDVVVKILPAKYFREGLQGFAINRKEHGQISEVVVKEDTIDRVMVILGHELGHIMSKRLDDARSEEAKAFAFSIAWIKAIKENNIAGLSTAVCIDHPAKNGIHDIAHQFVVSMIQSGKSAMNVFKELISGEIRC